MAPSAVSLPSGDTEMTVQKQIHLSEINNKLNILSLTQSPTASFSTSDQPDSNFTPHTPSSPFIGSPETDTESELKDLICIGFGPASLSIGIALHDSQNQIPKQKVLYLTTQPSFSWHSGMQLPSARMQISFLKDLATPRSPISRFTFLNYLKSVGRLDHFINLGTFLPRRREWEDYLKWCASWFEGRGEVRYGIEVEGVSAGERDLRGRVASWVVTGRRDGEVVEWKTRNVVVAVGGRGVIPLSLQNPDLNGRVFHSSEYAHRIASIENPESKQKQLRFAVIGSGQSAAEIFNDLWDRFPTSSIKLILKGQSLRPSDDSPFVNEIFNPSNTSTIFSLPLTERKEAISLDRATNYGVVRLELLEHLYEKLYMQRLSHADGRDWRCQIIPNRTIVSASLPSLPSDLEKGISLKLSTNEGVEVDYVFAATGYIRDVHERILAGTKDLLPSHIDEKTGGEFEVGRDYKIKFDKEKVDGDKTGVWLQGCCEGSHGLSDTLLSVLAVRGGEVVESIFGEGRVCGEEMKM